MNYNTPAVDEHNDKEIKALTELPDSLSGGFFKRHSPVIPIPFRNCASPQKVAYSLTSEKPSVLGNDEKLNTRFTSYVEITTTRRILSNYLANLPTMQQILIQKKLNSEIQQALTDKDSDADSINSIDSEEENSIDFN